MSLFAILYIIFYKISEKNIYTTHKNITMETALQSGVGKNPNSAKLRASVRVVLSSLFYQVKSAGEWINLEINSINSNTC